MSRIRGFFGFKLGDKRATRLYAIIAYGTEIAAIINLIYLASLDLKLALLAFALTLVIVTVVYHALHDLSESFEESKEKKRR